MRFVNVNEGERFFIRVLLCHLQGVDSYKQLRTLPNGTVCQTFRDAAVARGFFVTDEEYLDVLQESCDKQWPRTIRALFVNLLKENLLQNLTAAWGRFKEQMSDDILFKISQRSPKQASDEQKRNAENMAL
jgi:hypothetical protein